MFAEISHERETVLGTLTTRASTDPMLSGSVRGLSASPSASSTASAN